MKYKIIIFFLIISNYIIAQRILPLETDKSDYTTGDYFKDLDGVLDKYAGIWQGSWNGKTVILELRKVKDRYYVNPSKYYYSDQILGGPKIISQNGIVEYDGISNGLSDFNTFTPEFYGLFGEYNNYQKKYLLFQPRDMCNKTANAYITFNNPANTEMRIHYEYNSGHIDESCKYYDLIANQNKDYPINFPKDIVLTKQ